MRRVIPWTGLVACCAVVVIGCGPMTGPMPQRMPDDQQKEIDHAWDTALTPVKKHDRQTWLDVMVLAHAYQTGVDELHLRSVKKWSGGTVVMEIHTDRAKPFDEGFALTVSDRGGNVIRKETYTRDEVERAAKDFEDANRNSGLHPPEQKVWLEERCKQVQAILPFQRNGNDDPAK